MHPENDFMTASEAHRKVKTELDRIFKADSEALIETIKKQIVIAVSKQKFGTRIPRNDCTDNRVSKFVVNYFETLGYHIDFVDTRHTYYDGTTRPLHYIDIDWRER